MGDQNVSRVGMIGLGDMGSGLARNLMAAGRKWYSHGAQSGTLTMMAAGQDPVLDQYQ